ncbi:MAG TPA: zinc-ribbon domain containing protein [Clostridia bacterium]|nr:zinc-ribbon domain containing protein [Clostridia bacterium]
MEDLSLPDKSITCRDCGAEFLFTESEQAFYQEKGFQNEPQRCPGCRAARKNNQRDGGRDSGYPRQMYPAICAQCGRETEVPFRPSSDKPVYCRDCFQPRERRRDRY